VPAEAWAACTADHTAHYTQGPLGAHQQIKNAATTVLAEPAECSQAYRHIDHIENIQHLNSTNNACTAAGWAPKQHFPACMLARPGSNQRRQQINCNNSKKAMSLSATPQTTTSAEARQQAPPHLSATAGHVCLNSTHHQFPPVSVTLHPAPATNPCPPQAPRQPLTGDSSISMSVSSFYPSTMGAHLCTGSAPAHHDPHAQPTEELSLLPSRGATLAAAAAERLCQCGTAALLACRGVCL
jgi:hypothetical protein